MSNLIRITADLSMCINMSRFKFWINGRLGSSEKYKILKCPDEYNVFYLYINDGQEAAMEALKDINSEFKKAYEEIEGKEIR